jgi:hypothetical protein
MNTRQIWMSGLIVIAGAAVAAPCALGEIVETTGNLRKVAPPPSVEHGAFESNEWMHVFDELQNFVLTQDVRVDISVPGLYRNEAELTPAIIPRGTLIHSHFMHFDTVGMTEGFYEGSITFSGVRILGIIILDASLDDSDWLGAPGTIYPTGLEGRGLEDRPHGDIVFWREGELLKFEVSGRTMPLVDQLRVITLVPAPGATVLALMGAVCVLGRRRGRLA